ncbi:MAG: infB [Bacillales bacterium]|jgi:translation initiation factor IF-2|nr:infB [Bacillales bacterium]
MAKIRVYEFAKKHNISSKDVISKLKTMDIEVSNHMAMIDDSAVIKLEKMLSGSGIEEKKLNIEKQPSEKKQEDKKKVSNNNKPNNNKPNQNQKQSNTQKNSQSNNSQSANRPAVNNVPKPSTDDFEDLTIAKAPTKEKIVTTKKHVHPDSTKNEKNRGGFNNSNNRKKSKNRHSQPQHKTVMDLPKKISFESTLTVSELAAKLHREAAELIKKLFLLGIVATKNNTLEEDTIELICTDYGVEIEKIVVVDETDFDIYNVDDADELKIERPPVVTIMGHVDHGKTTLLDSIRNTKVTEGEAGGITQHIGAYQVKVNNKPITFLDTPGHEAFTTMRARGAQVTDITIIVVAADDGVMPQTVEAINHAKAAGVPIIIAVNKIDKPSANPDKVMQELTEFGLVPEDWGGDTIFVPVSAKAGTNIESLLEMILLVAEVEELKANPSRKAIGTVIEAQLDKGRGPVATLLVQNGTLHVGDPIVVGNTFGKVRAMVNDIGRRVKEALPCTPVEITGLSDVPQAGDRFVVFEDEKKARQIGEARLQKQLVEQRGEKSKLSLEDLFNQIKEGQVKDINLIVKADVHGSVEALSSSLQKIEVEGVKVKIIHSGVGAITEYDVMLASASNGLVIGFNVRPDVNAKRAAEAEKVDIRLHRIIYKVIEEIEAAMKGMLDPEFEEKIIGQAEVRQTFKVSKVGTIAGCYVIDGKISRDSGVRVIRNGVVVFEGKLDALKRFKDDAKEVAQGYECGITIERYNDIKEGDIIEAYVMQEIIRK